MLHCMWAEIASLVEEKESSITLSDKEGKQYNVLTEKIECIITLLQKSRLQ